MTRRNGFRLIDISLIRPNNLSNITPTDELEEIHREIDECRVCASVVRPFEKPIGLVRGGVSQIVIVGQEPGRTELAAGRAFAGMSG
ncbi:MAG: hypothetical protein ACMG6H_11445, partial [Acidobacteriota bacterium]